MTLSDLLAQVRALLAYELESEAYSDADLLPYVHHALRDFALQGWWRFTFSRRKDSAGLLPAGTREVDFADSSIYEPPLIQVRRIWFENRELQLVTMSDVGRFLSTFGTPAQMLVEGSRVQLFPVPSSAGVIVAWGIRYPTLPTQGTDLIDMPAGYEAYLPHGVVWQVAFHKGVRNTPNVQRSLQVWQSGITAYKVMVMSEALRDEVAVRWRDW